MNTEQTYAEPIQLIPIGYRLPWSHYRNVDEHHFAEIRATKFKDQQPIKWAIREQSSCLTKEGIWEIEPSPSNRDEEFFQRARYDSPEEAYQWAQKHFQP